MWPQVCRKREASGRPDSDETQGAPLRRHRTSPLQVSGTVPQYDGASRRRRQKSSVWKATQRKKSRRKSDGIPGNSSPGMAAASPQIHQITLELPPKTSNKKQSNETLKNGEDPSRDCTERTCLRS